MKDTSLVQRIATWLIVIVLVLLGLNVLLKKDKPAVEPRVMVTPTVISPTVYPCLAGDKCN